MKRFISLFLILFSLNAFAQDAAVTSCSDNALHADLVSINNGFEGSGFELVQFKTMNLQSKALLPIMVSLTAGKMYQINFLGNKEAKDITLVLFDNNRNKLVDKKKKIKADTDHLITVSFAAPYTGNYMVIVSQNQKTKQSSCAGFSILKGRAN